MNLAAIRQFYFAANPGYEKRLFHDVIIPAFGFFFCVVIMWGLLKPAKIIGGLWMLAGLLYIALQTRGFRRPPAILRDE